MKLGLDRQLTRTDFEIADVTRPIMAVSRLRDAAAQVVFLKNTGKVH